MRKKAVFFILENVYFFVNDAVPQAIQLSIKFTFLFKKTRVQPLGCFVKFNGFLK